METKISIILPVYNVEKYVVKCLQSIIQQSYPFYELLVIDDCGTDKSVELVKEFLSGTSIEWRLIHQEANKGVSAARNRGIREASGDYLLFVDSDDELTPDCLSVLSKPLEKNSYDIIVAGYQTFGNSNECFKPSTSQRLVTNDEVIEFYAKGGWHIMPWNKLCRRDFLIENKLLFLDGQALHEDYIWSFEVACKAQSAYLADSITYRYRINDESVMNSISIESDLAAYVPALRRMTDCSIESSLNERWKYYMIEGKKCGILYSLLQSGEMELYTKYYPEFHAIKYISPFQALSRGIISFPYFIRDLDNILPASIGYMYKRLFYTLYYKLRNKRIDGALWQ